MNDHPPPEQLRQFHAEQLDGMSAQLLQEHLDHCDQCMTLLESLSDAPEVEGWRRLLRSDPIAAARAAAPHVSDPADSRYATLPPPASAAPFDPGAWPGTPGPLTGTKLDKYQIGNLLGEGGMGQVYAAEDNLGRRVALKVMRPELGRDEAARNRFLREARAVAALQCDHVIHVFEADEAAGVLFLVMPLLQGETLKDRLRHGPPLTVAEILQIGRETAAGLAAAHARGLIHRDIKPANLFLERLTAAGTIEAVSFRVRILDFGLARAQDGSDALSATGALSGTLYYMSPEQVECKDLDGRSDLFSLGSVLYLLATGVVPFQGDNPAALARAVVEGNPKPPHECNPAIPPELSQLILGLLAKRADQRPDSATKVVAAIRAIEAGRPGERPEQRITAAVNPAEVSTVTFVSAGRQAADRRKPLQWWRWAAVAATLTVAAAVAAVLILFPPWKAADPGPGRSPLFKGSLDVRVTEKGDKLRQRLFLNQPHALPLKAGMQMEFEATVDRLAYLYVVYLDSNGEATPLFPWKAYDWKQRPAEERRIRLFQKGPLGESPSGIESLLLLVREEPLPDDVDVAALFTGLPKQKGLSDPRAWAWFEDGQSVPGDGVRGPARVWQGEGQDDPVLRTQALLRDKLRPLFPYTRAVCFAFQGD